MSPLNAQTGHPLSRPCCAGDPSRGQLARFFVPLALQAASQSLTYPLVAMVALLGVFLKFTRFGTAIRATSQSREAAMVVGIPVKRVHWSTFAIGTMLAALGGALIGPLFLVFPQMGDVPLIKGLAGILLGGMGSVPGAVAGGMIIGVVESVSTLFLPTDYRDSIAFMVMVAILLVRPQGLFGVRMRGED